MLRRFLPATLLMAFAAVASLGSQPAAAQQNPDFYVVNSSGRTINQIYVSSAATSTWGADRLGQNVLNSGMRFAIRLPRDGNCVFDIRVVYADGGAEERRRVNTCAVNEVIFATPGGGRTGQQAAPNPDFRLVNRSGLTITEVYVSPSTQQGWGVDRLGQNVLAPGQSVVIASTRDGTCVFDIRVVYQNNTATERRRVNTCNVTEITFP